MGPRHAVLVVCCVTLAGLACGDRKADPGSGACVPATCASMGGACGSFPDGCGAQVACGCPDGQTCSASACIPPSSPPQTPPAECRPLFSSCEEIGRTCGEVRNGCGETIDCGTCPESETCGGSGQPGTCASPPADPIVSWWRAVGTADQDGALAIHRARDGAAILLWAAASEYTLRLERVTADGAHLLKAFVARSASSGEPLFVRSWAVRASDGSLYLSLDEPKQRPAVVDLGGGPRPLPIVAQLAPDGALVREVCAGSCRGVVEAGSAGGDVIWSEWGDGQLAIVLDRADGVRVPIAGRTSDGASGPLAPDACWVATFVGDEVVCGGSIPGEVEFGFSHYSAPIPSLARLDRTGRVLWSLSVPGVEARVGNVGATPRGTIVASGSFFGFGRFGDDWLDYRRELPMAGWMSFVLAVEPGGAPRWARQIEGGAFAQSVAPEGGIALALGGDLGSSRLAVFDGAGALRLDWRFTSNPWIYAPPVAVGAEDLVAAITFRDGLVFGPPPSDSADVAVVSVPF